MCRTAKRSAVPVVMYRPASARTTAACPLVGARDRLLATMGCLALRACQSSSCNVGMHQHRAWRAPEQHVLRDHTEGRHSLGP